MSKSLCTSLLGYLLDISPVTCTELKSRSSSSNPFFIHYFPSQINCHFHHCRCSSQNPWRQPSFFSFIIHIQTFSKSYRFNLYGTSRIQLLLTICTIKFSFKSRSSHMRVNAVLSILVISLLCFLTTYF